MGSEAGPLDESLHPWHQQRDRWEESNTNSHNRVSGKMYHTVSELEDQSEHQPGMDTMLERIRTCEIDANTLIRSRTWMSPRSSQQQFHTETKNLSSQSSPKRRFSLQLPSFNSLGISTIRQSPSAQDVSSIQASQSKDMRTKTHQAPHNSLAIALRGNTPPLTPPPEDVSVSVFHTTGERSRSESNNHSASHDESPDQQSAHTPEPIRPREQGIVLPESLSMSTPSQLRKLPWVAKATQNIVISLNSEVTLDRIQVVSQTLPSQAKDSRTRPTFEEILETLQLEVESSPYITITHAVPQARVMEELPKTPPSTPSFRHQTHDYFANDDQTIFTHAAVVPIYHTHDPVESRIAEKLVRQIAAPGSTQVSILERYIPPTMPQEVDDFFSTSSRSYLMDRLQELSPRNGSLLLVYPTRTGGTTFTRRYIGPIIDPYLRRFVMLNDLTSDAAALMGTMTAVNSMVDFDEMKERINTLCQNLNARASGRGPKSSFKIAHSETVNVVLDRKTWINWYIEQEQSRLRQNLVEYHQSGGRMPQSEGNREVTVGMLTRDFIDGIQRSQEATGNEEIELGVFLITRSKIQDSGKQADVKHDL